MKGLPKQIFWTNCKNNVTRTVVLSICLRYDISVRQHYKVAVKPILHTDSILIWPPNTHNILVTPTTQTCSKWFLCLVPDHVICKHMWHERSFCPERTHHVTFNKRQVSISLCQMNAESVCILITLSCTVAATISR